MDIGGMGRLQAVASRNQWRVQDYVTGFSWLWSIELETGDKRSTEQLECLEDWLWDGKGEKNILIVWDGMPPLDIPPIKITNHLTPMDWALSFSRRVLSDPREIPDLRIVILDCYSRNFPDAYACRMMDSLLATLPWLGVMRLMPHSPHRSLANQCDADWLKKFLFDGRSAHPTLRMVGRVQATKAVDALVHTWLGDLARSTTHHDVNNLLGPLILLSAFNRNIGSYERGRVALLQHARWLGIAPAAPVDAKSSEAWIDAQSLAEELNRTIRFILVDDQANNGWKDVIATALGFPNDLPIQRASAKEISCVAKNGQVELWATTSADPIVANLNKMLAPGSPRDMRFGLQITEPAGADRDPPLEVLLLDLRLAADADAEQQIFRATADLASWLQKQNSDGRWIWRPLVDDPPKDLRGGNSQLHLLTLLPRIIATLDMSLPIIIFSSTGQRTITEQVKDYGNIITNFEKPRFASYRSTDVFLEAKSGLCAAIGKSGDILRARLAIQNVFMRSTKATACANADKGKKYLIELFLDETGNEFAKNGSVTVVGILLIGPIDAVQKLRRVVEERIKAIQAANPRNFKKQKEQLTNNAEQLAKCVEENSARTGVHVSLVSLTGRFSDSEAVVGKLESEFKADNLYRGILSALIEISVYHHAAYICNDVAGAEYKVYMATRVKPGTEEDQQDAWERWGIEAPYVGEGGGLWNAIDRLNGVAKNGGDELLRQIVEVLSYHASSKLTDDGSQVAYPKIRRIRYVDFGAARPIVRSISQHYRNSKEKFKPHPEHARAYGINHPDRWTQPFHFLADSLTSRGVTGEAIARLKLAGFSGEYSADLQTLLLAARQGSNGLIGDGLATAARCKDLITSVAGNDARRRLLGRLATFAKDISGSEFMRTVKGIQSRAWSREQGIISWIDRGKCSVRMTNGDDVGCPQSLRLSGTKVYLCRGDLVTIDVTQENAGSETKIFFERLVRVERNPQWMKLQKGGRVTGNIGPMSRGEVIVRVDEIDGVVPLSRIPKWSTPPRGTSVQFAVDDIDPLRARLVLLPIL